MSAVPPVAFPITRHHRGYARGKGKQGAQAKPLKGVTVVFVGIADKARPVALQAGIKRAGLEDGYPLQQWNTPLPGQREQIDILPDRPCRPRSQLE